MSLAPFKERYKIIKKIGAGSFGKVLKCKNRQTGQYLAAKRLRARFEKLENVFESPEIITMLNAGKHPNILAMIEFYFDPFTGDLIYIYELMNTTLHHVIQQHIKFEQVIPETTIKKYLHQILSGVNHLHKNGLFHRDIKPENVLVKYCTEDHNKPMNHIIKIADFGSIRGIYSQQPYSMYVATKWYRAPECILTDGLYGPKMDIWAIGCVLYELLALQPMFRGKSTINQLKLIHHVLGTPSAKLLAKMCRGRKPRHGATLKYQRGIGLFKFLGKISKEAKVLIKLMIAYDPDKRHTTDMLLQQSYFSDFRHTPDNKRSLTPIPHGSGDSQSDLNVNFEPKPKIRRSF